VEGLVHISELAQHHVENPREVVSQGDTVKAKIIEMDPERRRLSLSLKRVDEGEEARGEGAPELGLSEEVFAESEAEAVFAESAAEAAGPEEVSPEEVDQSIEADSVAPDEQGPGDSEGGHPEPPEEEPQ
jgi:small subunit ribosomal protein S1